MHVESMHIVFMVSSVLRDTYTSSRGDSGVAKARVLEFDMYA